MGALLTQFMNKYAYTDFHELNADWMIRTMMELINQVENFVSLNAIKYADPIQWDITKQYEKNTVVIDPLTGTAYISTHPVPMGVALTNTDYWTVVFDLGSFVVRAAKNFSNHYEAETTLTATFPSAVDQWLVWGDTLYAVISPIIAGDQYVVDSNIKRITVEEVCDALAQAIQNVQNNVDTLDTKVGDLNNLTTIDKSSIVNAIIEVVNDLSVTNTNIKNKPFINVLDFGAIGDGIADDFQAFYDAINESAAIGATVIVPDGIYYLSSEPSTTNLNSGDDINLLMGHNVEFTGPGAGDPNYPTYNGKLLSPITNKGNRLRGFSFKSYNDNVSPAGNGSVLHAIEWIGETSNETLNITASMNSGSSTMQVSSTDGIKVGDAVYPVNTITSFPDGSTRSNAARVVSIDSNNNTLEIGFPSANPSSWAGVANASPWTGATFTNEAFIVRHRFWNVTEFIGARANGNNPDRVGYGINVVAQSEGAQIYGIEIDMDFGSSQIAQPGIVHKGIMIAGFGHAQPSSKAIEIVYASSNYSVGIDIKNSFHGLEIDSAGGIIISNVYHNSYNNTVQPPLFGIKTNDIADTDLSNIVPFIAAEQSINGSTLLYLRRDTDTSPAGMFISCKNKANDTQLFGVDIEGRIGAAGAYVGDFSATTGAITTATITTLNGVGGTFTGTLGIDTCQCGNISTGVLKIAASMYHSGTITPTHYVTIYDTNGTAHNVPCT